MSSKTYFFLSGLPRSGSTLLSSILSQNPDIYAGGNSPLCQMMWDLSFSIDSNCKEQFLANNLLYKKTQIISSIPDILYSHIDKKYIVDKCRSWTLPNNVELIKNYISNDFKIIILIRNIEDILKSFLFIDKNINYENTIFKEYTDPLMRSLDGVIHCISSFGEKNILVINYDFFLLETNSYIEKIYDFLEIPKFKHDLNSIINKYPENDEVYGIDGMHDVRSQVEKRNYNISISKDSKDMCMYLNRYLKKYL